MVLDRVKTIGLAWQGIAYLIAIGAALWTFRLIGDPDLIWRILAADAVATGVIFIFSRTFNNSSFYDPYWSLQPIVIAAALFIGYDSEFDLRRHLVLGLIAIYGLRLTYNFYRTWPGLHHQDWRYENLQVKHGRAYWWVSFAGIHLFPTLLVFAGCLAMIPVFIDPLHDLYWLDGLGMLILVMGIWIEFTADQQLYRFRLSEPPPGSLLQSGLWSQMRHPNYLGEIMVWWGLYLFGLAANPVYWWTIIGPLAIHLLFVFISIPMKDKRMLNSRAEYTRRMQEIPALWPKIIRFK